MSPEDPRVPPNQKVTKKFPVLHVGSVPKVDLNEWNLTIEGLVKNPMKLKLSEVLELPKFD
ncbi:MAG: molybdopterin-dependent oxidoreductase, partial [Candidatus Bathyarchaeota archaeon]|nr:molybdopterin-dependent oxidoreductase [Candidatus Bathyarchaeota archaeon]